MIDLDVRHAIDDLIAECAHCIDDDRLEEWPSFFVDDCRYMMITRDNHERGMPVGIMTCDSKGMLRDRVLAMREANIYEPHVYRHMIGSTRVLGETDGVYDVVSNYTIVRTMQEGDMAIFSAGKLADKIVFDHGRAQFKERIVICDSNRVDTLIVLPI